MDGTARARMKAVVSAFHRRGVPRSHKVRRRAVVRDIAQIVALSPATVGRIIKGAGTGDAQGGSDKLLARKGAARVAAGMLKAAEKRADLARRRRRDVVLAFTDLAPAHGIDRYHKALARASVRDIANVVGLSPAKVFQILKAVKPIKVGDRVDVLWPRRKQWSYYASFKRRAFEGLTVLDVAGGKASVQIGDYDRMTLPLTHLRYADPDEPTEP